MNSSIRVTVISLLCVVVGGTAVLHSQKADAQAKGAPPRAAPPPPAAGGGTIVPNPNQGPQVNNGPNNSGRGPNTNPNTPNNTPNGPNTNPNPLNNTSNGPNTNPNTPNNTPNGPNQNPNAPFSPSVNRNNLDQTPGATIPLGNLAFGSNGNFPWFLPFGGGYGSSGFGFGPNGYAFSPGFPAGADTNGYYGVGSGGYGFDNLAGGQSLGGFAPSGNVPVVEQLPGGSAAAEQRQMIENAKAANLLYYQFRENNRAYRARQIARNRATPETVAKVALESLPRSLGPDEFDPATGKIAWPEPLLTDDYKNLRSAIEKFSPLLSTDRRMQSAAAIREITREMVDTLRMHIEDIPADEYMTARKFLDSVEYAANKSVSR